MGLARFLVGFGGFQRAQSFVLVVVRVFLLGFITCEMSSGGLNR